jgi:hypothetical protein
MSKEMQVLNDKVSLYKSLKQFLNPQLLTETEIKVMYLLEQDWQVQRVLIKEESNNGN